jgi:hypothetical protein
MRKWKIKIAGEPETVVSLPSTYDPRGWLRVVFKYEDSAIELVEEVK